MGVKAKKALAWIGLILLTIIAAGLALRAIFNYINGQKLERYLAELKARHQIVEPSSLFPPCPDQENAALPWKAVESLLILDQDDKSLLAAVSEISEWKEFSPDKKNKLAAIVEKNRKAIDLLIEASTKGCFQYSDINKPPLERNVPNLSLMIQANRVLIIDALLKAEKGRTDEADEEILHGLQFARLCAQSPMLINFLVSMANTRMLVHNLNRLVNGRELPAETAARIMKLLDPVWWRKAMVNAFKAEYSGFTLEIYNYILRGEIISGVNSGWCDRAFYWLIRPVLKSEVIWVARHYQEMIESAGESFYRNEKTRQWQGQEIKVPAQYRLAGLILPNLYTIILKEATLEAYLEAARTGIACKIYQQQHRKYPDSISELMPDFLAAEPLDPFTGQPLVYKVKGDGFIVYSLGSNKKDDGGRMSMMTQAVMAKDDDWSWQENWK
ncbi:MAG: hypothetical protein H5U05_10495 [Candidatus Aminicenantes bacterium]|nr:hypothetical protein [Candidatus Aminicenantes bacterium]